MEILYVILILLVFTRLFGEFATRFGQPLLVGELLAGILIGLVVQNFSGNFPVLSNLTEDPVFHSLTDLGVFFLMLLGGIELKPKKLFEASKASFFIALCAMLVPLGLGFALGWAFLPESNYKFAQALFVGTALAITAVPVAVKVLLDYNALDSKLGRIIIAAAVFDDVLSLILLSVLTGVIQTGNVPELQDWGILALRMFLFFGVTVVLGIFVLPAMSNWIKKYVKADEIDISFLIIVALAFSLYAEFLHLHFIFGAFIAGLFFSRSTLDKSLYEQVKIQISGMTTGFFAPIFFASIGLHLNLSALNAIPLFLFLLLAAAFFSKFVGAYWPARIAGISKRDASTIGMAMNARGAVELIVADIALKAGLFLQPSPQPKIIKHLYSAIVIVAIVTTLVVPISIGFMMKKQKP